MNAQMHHLSIAMSDFKIQPEQKFRRNNWDEGSLSHFLSKVFKALALAVPESRDSPCMELLQVARMNVWLHETVMHEKLQSVRMGGPVDPNPRYVCNGYKDAVKKLEKRLRTPHPEDQTDPIITFLRNNL
ncbi:hypothetical protein FRC09_008981, partial [Ceratobasidium sp. 395]